MLDETRPINAKDLINDPDAELLFYQPYIMVRDMSLTSSYTSMIGAINLLAERGWEIGQLVMDSSYMYVLCRNPRFKRKRDMMDDETDATDDPNQLNNRENL